MFLKAINQCFPLTFGLETLEAEADECVRCVVVYKKNDQDNQNCMCAFRNFSDWIWNIDYNFAVYKAKLMLLWNNYYAKSCNGIILGNEVDEHRKMQNNSYHLGL